VLPSLTESIAQLRQKLRPDRVEVRFAPDQIELQRQSARGSNVQRSYAVNENSWQAAGATLGHALNELGWRNAHTSVRLSNHFVRYALVPGSAKLRNRAERLAAARHQLRALYGEHADRWLVVPAAAGPDCHLAAAVDSDLVKSLAETASGAGLQLRRIEPVLIGAYNAVRKYIDDRPTWLALAEPGRLCVAYFENRQWRLIRNERLRAAAEEELPLILERLCLAESAQPGRVLLDGALQMPRLGPDWSAEFLAFVEKKEAA
jgi:hypothetical protein